MAEDTVLFVAGSTGAVGRTVVRLAAGKGIRLVPHVRPRRAARGPLDPRAAVFELSDARALEQALRGCTTVLQLIGTRRSRFASGDTYETSDVDTTRFLVEGARAAGIRHLVLLSSLGTGHPVGPYLQAKARAERLATESGVPYTIVRPSAFVGEGHPPIPGMATLTRLPGLRGLRPIRVEQLAAALLHVALEKAPLGTILEGESLWRQVEAAEREGFLAAATPAL